MGSGQNKLSSGKLIIIFHFIPKVLKMYKLFWFHHPYRAQNWNIHFSNAQSISELLAITSPGSLRVRHFCMSVRNGHAAIGGGVASEILFNCMCMIG